MRIVVIGSGFAGAVFARLAADLGHRCKVFEARSQVGGNAFDRKVAGIVAHSYGPHYFRTDNAAVVRFLSRFTEWRKTVFRVLAKVRGKYVRFPISSGTYEDLYGKKLSTREWARELAARKVPLADAANAQEQLLSSVGEEFYKLFYEGYTAKQWGKHPRELLPYVVARIPVYKDDRWQYFSEAFQAQPARGYARMFENMLSHPLIDVRTSTPWDGERGDLTIYTGPLDAWFDCREGKLPYRSLKFRTRILARKNYQPCGQVNYPSLNVPYTRTLEWKHITGETSPLTVVTWESPADRGEPFYPMPTEEAARMAQAYRRLAAREKNVLFLGRLATYQYLNMDQVVWHAMQAARRALKPAPQPEESALGLPPFPSHWNPHETGYPKGTAHHLPGS